MSDAYRIVTANVRSVQANVIVIDKPHAPGTATIPRSLIHYADDKMLAAVPIPREGRIETFRLREWKAEQMGLAGI